MDPQDSFSPPSAASAVARARAAQPAWAALSFRERARFLRRLALHLRDDQELPRLISSEGGKPMFEAVGFEVGYVLETIRFLAGRAGRAALVETCRRPFVFPWKRTRVAWRPRGVVAVIGPWNFPLLNNFGDAVAPLLAGNALLLKPSPHTPGASRRVEQLWREAGLPDGVFQVIEGDAEVGRALVDVCDMVFFTGSVAGGRAVARRAGERLIPYVAELGGKSPMIVLADADLEAAARGAVWGAFANSGQICIRPERVLVQAEVADAFVALLVRETQALRVGPVDGDVDVGALMLDAQVERARAQIADAVTRGGQILCGGDLLADRPGRYFAPTAVDHVSPDSALAREETFAPVLPILRVRDADEAVRLANDSPFGLAGYVWSANPETARNVARRLQTGSVCINDVLVNYLCANAPLGGIKQSGLGFRSGPEGLRQFCYPQTIVEDRAWLRFLARFVRRRLGFPYRQGMLRLVRWLIRVLYP
jgi:acyl-CoA reductase-like NAD-dependent aldehyde dehydrogenase